MMEEILRWDQVCRCNKKPGIGTLHPLETAKEQISDTEKSISEVTYGWGFEKRVGCSLNKDR